MLSRPNLLGRRGLAAIALLALAGGAGYVLWGASDERRILNALRQLAHDLGCPAEEGPDRRRARARQALAEVAAPDWRLYVPELGEVAGTDAVAEMLAELAGVRLTFAIEQASVQASNAHAMATLLATLTSWTPGEERRDARTVRVELKRHQREFRIVSIRVEERSRAQPEARP